MKLPEAEVERLVRDLSSYLSGAISVLECPRHGIEKDDVLQEVYIRILKVIQDNNHGVRYFQAYLNKVIHSVFMEELTEVNRDRRARRAQAAAMGLADGSNGKGVPRPDTLAETLEEAIEELGEPDAGLMKLRMQGFTLEEIARLKRWTYNRTCYIFYRGLKELKAKLKERGVDYEG